MRRARREKTEEVKKLDVPHAGKGTLSGHQNGSRALLAPERAGAPPRAARPQWHIVSATFEIHSPVERAGGKLPRVLRSVLESGVLVRRLTVACFPP